MCNFCEYCKKHAREDDKLELESAIKRGTNGENSSHSSGSVLCKNGNYFLCGDDYDELFVMFNYCPVCGSPFGKTYLDFDAVDKVLEANKDKLEYYDVDDRQEWWCVKGHEINIDIEQLNWKKPSEFKKNTQIPYFHIDTDRAYGVGRREIRITIIKEVIPTEEWHEYGFGLGSEDVADVPFRTKNKLITKDIESIEELEECFKEKIA